MIENTAERPAPATAMTVAVTAKPSASEGEGASCVPSTVGLPKSEHQEIPLYGFWIGHPRTPIGFDAYDCY
jgi:hypothetical protein